MDFSACRHQVTLDAQQLSYLDIGQGPTLLFGHGYLCDSRIWAPQLAQLSQDYRCIVPDLWGHGHSGALPASCRNLQDLAKQMLALLDLLKIDSCELVGHGMGAIWGTELALLAPGRVRSLVLLNSFIGFEPEVTRDKYLALLDEAAAVGHFPSAMIDSMAPLFFAADTRTRAPDLYQDFCHSLATHGTTHGTAPHNAAHDSANSEAHNATNSAEPLASLVRLGRMLFGRRDLLEEVEALALPCLIMVGCENRLRTVLESYLMHDALDGSEYVQLQHAGHLATLEQAEVVTARLGQFLSRP
ncbi:alpha/beta fold hydrolase [Shewanella salipaludis]|uniref:Alpha/beta hydrolase n=1 Tax=Shewanella salipaludis TaxID=2723052 RepID=A0A972FVV6_9GAMM|nr:alpha/beta hydrolase [Shewanella salipaludis]NMH67038.1 alpha/beta hydrolase [Shewanella salipaludis]